MRRITNTHELVGALHGLLNHASSDRPSRAKLASELRDLSQRVRGAASKTAASPVVSQMLGAFEQGQKHPVSDLHDLQAAARRLCQEVTDGAASPFQPALAKAPTGTFNAISDALYDLAFAMGSASAGNVSQKPFKKGEAISYGGVPGVVTKNQRPGEATVWVDLGYGKPMRVGVDKLTRQ